MVAQGEPLYWRDPNTIAHSGASPPALGDFRMIRKSNLGWWLWYLSRDVNILHSRK